MSPDKNLLSKLVAGDKHGEDSPYFDGWKAYDNNPFHPDHNPQGVIQMGLAENQVRLLPPPNKFSSSSFVVIVIFVFSFVLI